jgi:hypothetical protein
MCLDQLLEGGSTGQGDYDDALEEDDEVRAPGEEEGELDIDDDDNDEGRGQ